MIRRFLACLALTILPMSAQTAPADDLLDALRVDEMIEVMRIEGVDYGREMAEDMFAGGSNPQWEALLTKIYDADSMQQVVRAGFVQAFGDAPADPLLDYFAGEDGQQIVALELSAREAMIDDGVEEVARESYRALQGRETERIEILEGFIEANDLIEANVAGALNASFQFYRGLIDGGAFEMTEADVLRDVWGQEDETRSDTREWLYAFLLMAYGPMSDDQLRAYVELSATESGRAMNRALFAGFNAMYDNLSYALGLAAARQMQAQEL